MRQSLLIIFLCSAILTLSGCKVIINMLAFHPDKEDILPKNRLPDGVEEIFIKTADNITLLSLYLPVKESDTILIYFHGNAGNIYHRIPDLLHLQSIGINVLGVSYRGYAKSTGKPSEKGIYQDGEAVFSYVMKELGFAEQKIVLLGRSIGTTVAIHTSQFKNISGLILISPLTSGKEHAQASGLGLISFLAGNAFNNLAKIKNVHVPLVVVHGTHDRVIPFSMGKKLYEEANGNKQFAAIEGAGHNDLSYEPLAELKTVARVSEIFLSKDEKQNSRKRTVRTLRTILCRRHRSWKLQPATVDF